jgi:hypothetical protein
MRRGSHMRIRSAICYVDHYAFSASVLALYKCDHDDDNCTSCVMAKLSNVKKRRDDGH